MSDDEAGPDVAALGDLARIQLSDAEREALAAELPRIVKYLAAIRKGHAQRLPAAATEEETKGPEAARALAQPLRDVPELARQASGDGLRPDEVEPFADVQRIQRLFPKSDGGRIQVPKGGE